MQENNVAIYLSLGDNRKSIRTWSSKRRTIAPDAPLIVTNLLKYEYLHVGTDYQTNSSGHRIQ
jgi:hypothetical protein